MPDADVIVVGGGISGMTAAFRLRQRGFAVTVLEAADTVGGKMGTVRREGFSFNRGAQLMPSAYAETMRIARDAGAAARLEEFTPSLAVMRDGRAHTLRGAGAGMLLDGLRTDLVSWPSKLLMRRMAVDAFRMRDASPYEAQDARARWDTETVAEYCERRLNAEIRDYVIDPVLRALVLIDAQQMPIVDFYVAAANFFGSKLLRYPGGYEFLAKALAQRVGDVRLGARVEHVEKAGDGVRVTWRDADGEHSADAAGVVLAVPGPAAADVFPALDARRREILTRDLDHSLVIAVHAALSRPLRDDVVAITVPSAELDGLAAVIFEHVSRADAAPPGKGLISAYFEDAWSAPRAGLADDELLAQALALIERVVPGATASAEFTHVDRWSPCTPVYREGSHRLIAELNHLADPGDRVQLAGDYTGIATVNGCVVSGEAAASRLAATIRHAPSRSREPAAG